MSNGYYPIMLRLDNQCVVIIGGGSIAARKAKGLLESGAEQLIVVAPNICDQLRQFVNEGLVCWRQEHYELDVLKGAKLVFAATDDHHLNEQISIDASLCDILVCNVSDGTLGSFITPAIARSGGFTAAISSSGASPGLTKHLRQHLEAELLPPYEELHQLMQCLRADVMNSDLKQDQRQRMLRYGLEEVLAALKMDEKSELKSKAYTQGHVLESKYNQRGSNPVKEEYEAWYEHLYTRVIREKGEDIEDGEEDH